MQYSTSLDQIPGESFFVSCLQKNLNLSVDNKQIKKGKLLLFRRAHYYIQLMVVSDKGTKECIDIPIPFKIENYSDEGLIYFDYRTTSLELNSLPRIPEKTNFSFFNKILEIQAV